MPCCHPALCKKGVLPTKEGPEYSLQQPGQRQREQGCEQCRGPVAQMMGRQVAHHEMIVDEIDFQTKPAEEYAGATAPGWRDAEEVAEQEKK